MGVRVSRPLCRDPHVLLNADGKRLNSGNYSFPPANGSELRSRPIREGRYTARLHFFDKDTEETLYTRW